MKNQQQTRKKEKLPVEVLDEVQLVSSSTHAIEATLSSDKMTETRKRQTDMLRKEILTPASKQDVHSAPPSGVLSANDRETIKQEPTSKQTTSKEGKRVRIMQEAGEVLVFSERKNTEVSRPTPSPRSVPRFQLLPAFSRWPAAHFIYCMNYGLCFILGFFGYIFTIFTALPTFGLAKLWKTRYLLMKRQT